MSRRRPAGRRTPRTVSGPAVKAYRIDLDSIPPDPAGGPMGLLALWGTVADSAGLVYLDKHSNAYSPTVVRWDASTGHYRADYALILEAQEASQ